MAKIRDIYVKVTTNVDRSRLLVNRCNNVETSILEIKRNESMFRGGASSLNSLIKVLEDCLVFISNFTSQNLKTKFYNVFECNTINMKFQQLNSDLSQASIDLQLNIAIQSEVRIREDEAAASNDNAAHFEKMIRLISESGEVQDNILSKIESTGKINSKIFEKLSNIERVIPDLLNALIESSNNIYALQNGIDEEEIKSPEINTPINPNNRKLLISRLDLTLLHWEKDLKNLLGKGSFGSVYTCQYENIVCAIKQFENVESLTNAELKKIRHEAKLLQLITHKNIIGFVGVCVEQGIIVSELALTSLFKVLHNEAPLPAGQTLDDTLRSKWILNILSALRYLHFNEIVHRDIKPANILLVNSSDGVVAKVSDFGLSLMLNNISSSRGSKSGTAGSTPYMPPEQLDPEAEDTSSVISSSCDIYSMGIMMNEMFTGSVPWAGLKDVVIAMRVFTGRQRPPLFVPFPTSRIQATISEVIGSAATGCLAHSRENRPTAKDIYLKLEDIVKSEIEDSYLDNLSNSELEQARVNFAEEILAMKRQHLLESTDYQTEIGQLRAQIVVLETKAQQDQMKHDKNDTRLNALQYELALVKEAVVTSKQQAEDLTNIIAALEQQRDKLEDNVVELKTEHKKQLDALQEEITSLQDKVSLQSQSNEAATGTAAADSDSETMNEAPGSSDDDVSNPDLEQAMVNFAEEILAMKRQHLLESTDYQTEIGQLRAQIVVLEMKAQQDQMRDLLLDVDRNKLKSKDKQVEELTASCTQLEALNKQYRAELKQSEATLDSLKQELAASSPSKDAKRYEETLNALPSEVKHVTELRDLIDRERHKVKIKEKHVEELLILIDQLEKEKKELRHSLHASVSPRFSMSPRFSGSLSPRLDTKIAKLQAVVRGFIARVRMGHFRVHHAALSAGVLFAFKNTVQGETGWYSSPNGSVFYFVNENGDYMLACGPLTITEYESIITLSNNKRNQGLLIKCDLKLAMMDANDDSEVYIAPKSKKLFLAVPVDGRCYLDEVEKSDSVEEEENNNKLNVIVT